MTSYVFDAAAILGIGTPLPDAQPGFITIRVPEGLSLQSLRDSAVGKTLMWQQEWYDRYPWSREAPPAGTYRLRLPVPGSGRKTVGEQVAMLVAGETLAPAALVAAALLCIELQGGADPLNDGWTRDAEQTTADGRRVCLTWCGGRISVNDGWYDYMKHDACKASSVRTS